MISSLSACNMGTLSDDWAAALFNSWSVNSKVSGGAKGWSWKWKEKVPVVKRNDKDGTVKKDKLRSKNLWQPYINTIVDFLNTVHYPVFK